MAGENTQSEPAKKKKILVLGSKGHSKEVDCYEWGEWGDDVPNVADYDVIFLNLESLTEEKVNQKIMPKNLLSRDNFVSFFLSKGEIFVIAAPYISFQMHPIGELFNNYWWCPFSVQIEERSGDTLAIINQKFENYFDFVRIWKFYFADFMDTSRLHRDITKWSKIFEISYKSIAENRIGKFIGVTVFFELKSVIGEGLKCHENSLGNSGPIHFLHPPTEITSKEGIDLLLKEFYRITLIEEPPSWTQEIKVPGQTNIEERIEESNKKIALEKNKIMEAERNLASITRFKELLYARSEQLEKIVWDILRELGAEVVEPKVKNEEDGRIKHEYGEGVLEIKGKGNKSASTDDVRELDDWVSTGLKEGKKFKGILIVNHYCEKSLAERGEPFPPDVRDYARERKFCLMTTIDLFKAYCLFKEDKIDINKFWQDLFKCEEVFNI